MLRSLMWKLVFYAAISLFAIILLMPTVISHLPSWWSKILPTEKIRLGLDLQGGMYVLLEVEAQKAVESYLEQIRSSLQEALKEESVPVTKLETEKTEQIVLEFSGSRDKVDRLLGGQGFSMLRELSATTLSGGIWKMVLVPESKQVEQIKKNAVDQALEIIRNRIDQFGVTGPEIARQGTDQILVQLPGIRDPEERSTSSEGPPCWNSSWSMKREISTKP
jgi:preprotein translocase subunit SecD